MDAVVIAEAIDAPASDTEGSVPMRITRVLKGEDLASKGQEISAVYFGKVEAGRRFMLTGVDPPKMMWSSPLPVTKRSEQYLIKLMQLPDDSVERLKFFQQYLEDEDTMLARDAYDEFAIAPYEDVQALAPHMDHDQLVAWVSDPEMPAERRRLYLTMLGVCGTQDDVPMLKEMLVSTQPSRRNGLDALIACYLTLQGEEGLPLVVEEFLANKQSEYADTYAAIMALRFHGTETDVIPREKIATALHQVLERPDLADLVIPDLARWNDWSQIDRLVQLFKDAEKDNNWVRVPVINYLRTCPLPEAKKALEELEKIDPEAVRRANTFFAIPQPATGSTETSMITDEPSVRIAATHAVTGSQPEPAAAAGQERLATIDPLKLLSVSLSMGATLWISMWLVLSGAAVGL